MSVHQVNMHEAKSRLSELGERAWKGERIVIARAGKPFLDLLPHREARAPRTPGRLKGIIRIADDFADTPDEVLDALEGRS